ncbi:MAG: hypothetical protein JSS86_14680 [Cyanobacteria bacterium SZAS LIN-2]|nr:hypothetical protein [Cyanobacteria bacterium SZAS LIN-2]
MSGSDINRAEKAPGGASDRPIGPVETPIAEQDWRRAYSLSSPEMRSQLSRVSENGDLHDHGLIADPCKKTVASSFAAGSEPQPMEKVKDRDPVLYAQIKGKVKDPTYIGQTGDVTVSTHDRRGRTNGCVLIQNEPYWLSGDAAKSYLDLNKSLAPLHKEISVDRLNGAGRTLGQEEAIAWRNSGVHAKPGKSNHGYGRAIDIAYGPDGQAQPYDDKDVREALHANGYRQGDSHGPLKNDLHHWSYTGPGRATEGHPSAHVGPHRHHHRSK